MGIKTSTKHISEKMDHRVDEYLFNIARICDDSLFGSVLHSSKSAFGILQLGSEEYYSFQRLERGLESVTREVLVNPILSDLFDETDQECLWPERRHHYVFFSNASIERIEIEPFEFIVPSKEERIGFRYSSLNIDTHRDYLKIWLLCKKHNISQIKIIDWSGLDDREAFQEVKNSSIIAYISLHDFFLQYFSESLYEMFVNKTAAAVSKANKIVGFNTIPRLSSHYLGSFKETVINSILNTKFDGMKYMGIGTCQLNQNTKKNLDPEDHVILSKHFIGDRLYQSLIGESDFGKCFITSEYLFRVFQDGERIDYTSVVSGYFKSIEQLLFHIMNEYLENSDISDNLFIKCDRGYKVNHPDFRINPNPKANGAKQVRFSIERKNCFSTSMASLAWLLNDNDNGWSISTRGKKIVCHILLDYIKECRNEHFHKDNIVDYEVVKKIRNNTILLMYLLLGGCKHSGSPEEIRKRFGIISNAYDSLYTQLIKIPSGECRYILKFEGGEPFKAIRLYAQPITKYNDNGNIVSPSVFVRVDNYAIDSHEAYQKLLSECANGMRIEITNDNMPHRIWLYLREGDIREITWNKEETQG